MQYKIDPNTGLAIPDNTILKPADITVQHGGMGVYGEFRAILRNKDESIAHDSGWNRNLITNRGLEYMNWNWYTWCCIGSDGTAPTTSDTSLGAFLVDGNDSNGTNPMPYVDYPRPPVGPNYERYSIKKYRIEAGDGTGTVREFSLGRESDGTEIFCRHVLPAPIPKDVDQSLDIFYRINVRPDLTPRTGQVTIDGILYDWESSFYDLDTYNTSLFTSMNFNRVFNSYFTVYDGAKAGPLDNEPSGNSANSGHDVWLAQGEDGTRGWIRYRYEVELDWCNTATNMIRVITTRLSSSHKIQLEISQNASPSLGIPKDNTKEMYIDWELSWVRDP